MDLTGGDILLGLQIAVAVLIIVLLYHLLFIAVDLRKILNRVEEISQHVEDMVMKPINMADTLLNWLLDMAQEQQKGGKKKTAKKKKGKK